MSEYTREEMAWRVLQKSLLGKDLQRDQLAVLLNAGLMTIREYREGEYVFRDYERPTHVRILCSGCVRVDIETETGFKNFISTYSREGIDFGAVSYLMGRPVYRKSAQVLDRTTLLELDARLIDPTQDVPRELKEIAAILRKNQMYCLASRYYMLSKRLRALSGSGIRGKIAQYLMDNHVRGESVVPVMSREKMAKYLNVTRPALSRELNNMAMEGLVALRRGQIEILDWIRLEQDNNLLGEPEELED
ncbi:MAG: Crp/Fnr family transcriptional regulator [Lachnospiraceae bacterium]|nr:Crp/Fnr family transcriptional regulator [Lachnospiraceae bacterium]